MTVTQRLMAPGGFSLKLRTDADEFPDALVKQIDGWDQLVITANRLEPITGFSDVNILSAAIYSGVITGFPQPGEFTGYDASVLMGTPDGAGQVIDTVLSRSAWTLSQWAGDLFPTNDVTAGVITTTGANAVTASYQFCTRREAWTSVCRLAGAEWRVNPDFTVDAAVPATLFVSTPRVVVTRKAEGTDGPYQGLEGSMLQLSKDFDQYTNRAIVIGQGAAGNVKTGTAGFTSPYTAPGGSPLVMSRFVNSPTDGAANALILAGEVVDAYSEPRRELRLSSRTYTVGRFVEPGDWIYAYDQVGGLYDTANQITYRGELITPLRLRVYAITWPIEEGMGVYVRRKALGGAVTYVDLTDHVAWEATSRAPGEVQWEVGAASRPASDTVRADSGVATLGVNPEITARMSGSGIEVAYAERTTPYNMVAGIQDIPGVSVTFTAPADRKYKITAAAYVGSSTDANVRFALVIADGSSAQIQSSQVQTQTINHYIKSEFSARVTPSAGSVTYKLRVQDLTGAAVAGVDAGATFPTFIQVEDIGPA